MNVYPQCDFTLGTEKKKIYLIFLIAIIKIKIAFSKFYIQIMFIHVYITFLFIDFLKFIIGNILNYLVRFL